MKELLQGAEIPLEDVNLPLGPVARQAKEEMAERLAFPLLVRIERDARVEVPADDEDTFLSRRHGRGNDVIIIACIDDHRRFFGARDAPDIAPLRDDRLQRRPLSLPFRHDKQKR